MTVYPHPMRLRWYLNDCVTSSRLPGFPAVRLRWHLYDCVASQWGYDKTLTAVYSHPVRLPLYLDDLVPSSSEVTMTPWQRYSLAIRLPWNLDDRVTSSQTVRFSSSKLTMILLLHFCLVLLWFLPLLFPLPSSRGFRQSSSVGSGCCYDFKYVRLGNVEFGNVALVNVELFSSVVCGMSVIESLWTLVGLRTCERGYVTWRQSPHHVLYSP